MPRRIHSGTALAVLLAVAIAAVAGSIFVGPTPWEEVTQTIRLKVRLCFRGHFIYRVFGELRFDVPCRDEERHHHHV